MAVSEGPSRERSEQGLSLPEGPPTAAAITHAAKERGVKRRYACRGPAAERWPAPAGTTTSRNQPMLQIL